MEVTEGRSDRGGRRGEEGKGAAAAAVAGVEERGAGGERQGGDGEGR